MARSEVGGGQRRQVPAAWLNACSLGAGWSHCVEGGAYDYILLTVMEKASVLPFGMHRAPANGMAAEASIVVLFYRIAFIFGYVMTTVSNNTHIWPKQGLRDIEFDNDFCSQCV